MTDGSEVFTIEANAARACSIASGTLDVCREIVTGEEIGQRVLALVPDFEEWEGWGGKKGGGPGGGPKNGVVGLPPLSPAAIALHQGRVVIADNGYQMLVACPSTGSCAGARMALVDTGWGDDDEDWETPTLGRSLALTSSSVVWTQGDGIRSAPLPPPGGIERRVSRREDDTTDNTARIAVPSASGLLWLSERGLHHADAPNAAPEQWFSRTGTDLAFDASRVYLASDEGLFRVSRVDKSAAISASGSFEHVAVDERGVYATKVEGTRTTVIEARAGKQLELAVIEGKIDGLAVAGDHVYFTTRVGEGSEIRRVAR